MLPMQRFVAGDNEVSCDVEATRAAYRAFTPAVCDCASCRNYRLARGGLFRGPVLDFLTQFGIDAGKQAEIYGLGPVQPGGEFIRYGGWFHFIGEIVRWGGNVDLDENLTLYFSPKIALAPESFLGHPLVQIELEFKLPWVLPGAWNP